VWLSQAQIAELLETTKQKSIRGVQFRCWATSILGEYLIQGYTIDSMKFGEENSLMALFENLISA